MSLSCAIVFLVMSGLNPREDEAKFCDFSQRAEGGPSRAGSRSKTFYGVPIIIIVSCAIQNRGKAFFGTREY